MTQSDRISRKMQTPVNFFSSINSPEMFVLVGHLSVRCMSVQRLMLYHFVANQLLKKHANCIQFFLCALRVVIKDQFLNNYYFIVLDFIKKVYPYFERSPLNQSHFKVRLSTRGYKKMYFGLKRCKVAH